MNIKHHLDTSTIVSFSSGTLGEALSAVVSAHLEFCNSCRNKQNLMDLVGSLLLEDIEPTDLKVVPISPNAFLSKKIITKAQNHSSFSNITVAERTKSKTVNYLLGSSFEDISWKWLAPGIRYHKIRLSKAVEGDLRLLKIAPKLNIPEHGHGGNELTLVLQGRYQDETGLYRPGDISDLHEDVVHQPKVVSHEPCICLVGFERPARFQGVLSRAVQPFIGM